MRKLLTIMLVLTAAVPTVPAQAASQKVNYNSTIRSLCKDMYFWPDGSPQQLSIANQVLTDAALNAGGPLSGYDQQCIADAQVIVYGG